MCKWLKDNMVEVIIAILLLFVVFFIGGQLVYNVFDTWEKRGQFGDMFGFFNSFFSGAAFFCILITVILQHNEIKNQHHTIGRQDFDNKFFQLLKIHNEIVNSVTVNSNLIEFDNAGITDYEDRPDKQISGRDAFRILYLELKRIYNNKNWDIIDQDREYIKKFYSEWHKEFNPIVGYYFRNLYNFCKFLKENDYFNSLTDSQRKSYSNILRAQLSSYEIVLLFYNSFKFTGFITYMKKFDLLDGIPREKLLDDEIHAKILDNIFSDKIKN